MPRTDPVLIFDLDGTILGRNSFPVWVLALLAGGGRSRLGARLATTWQVQRLLLRRKLRRLDHDGFMHALQDIWAGADATGTHADRLQRRLMRMVRPNLAPILAMVADGSVDAVLATAAAGEYAEPLAAELGFRHVLATPCGGQAACNRGATKRMRVEALLHGRGWADRPRIFFTDHIDDLPLMQASQAVCWLGPRKAMQAAQRKAPGARFVPCRSLRPEELRQALAHIGQSLETSQLASTVSFDRSPARIRTFS